MSNDLDDLMQRISENAMRTRNQHIEMMAAAYIKATGIHPEQVELVQDTDGNAITWRFRRSKDGDAIDYLGKRVASLIEQNDELRAKLAHHKATYVCSPMPSEEKLAEIRKACENHPTNVCYPLPTSFTVTFSSILKADPDDDEDDDEDTFAPAACTCKSLLAGHEPGCPLAR